MLSDKKIELDLRQNPGVMIGIKEMDEFLNFLKKLSRDADTQKALPKLS